MLAITKGFHSFEQGGDVLRRANILEGHRQEFIPEITVLAAAAAFTARKRSVSRSKTQVGCGFFSNNLRCRSSLS